MDKGYKPVALGNDIHWVGALDPELRRFDVVMETKYGTSYNAYIIKGKNKVALIDTVKDGFFEESLDRISKVVNPAEIDYIILQHTEPDHSGSIAALVAAAPKAKIYASRPGGTNIPHIANVPLNIVTVKDGDTLDLGGRVLKFIMAPFLHWPDTMLVYDENSSSLFTCDLYGNHYAPKHIRQSQLGIDVEPHQKYYYDSIMSPFASFAHKTATGLKEMDLKIDMILPSHGPVLDQDPKSVIDRYLAWSAPKEKEKKAYVGYVSCYGYTRTLAEALAAELTALGYDTSLEDVSLVPMAEVAAKIHASDIVALGSPTVNADIMPPVWATLTSLSVPVMRGKFAAAFGSYGWSGEAVPMLEKRLSDLGCKVATSVKVRFRPQEEDLEKMKQVAHELVEAAG